MRGVAAAAIAAAVLMLAVVLLSSGGGYTVDATFQNASQLVKGNQVQVAGAPVGTVAKIQLTDDGHARVRLEIAGEHAPLRRGTRAIIRQASLSGVANRYVDLHLGDGKAQPVPNGGTIDTDRTTSAVELDQLFNVFDPVARVAVQRDIEGFAEMNAGREEDAREALRYLDPALATSARLFGELDRNTAHFERFIVQTAGLVNTLAGGEDDLAGLVDNLGTTMSALAAQKASLGTAIGELPDFMRKANTTFLNLRATIDDLDPLVEASRPAARRLAKFLTDLRPFVRDARPVVRDLSRTIRSPGPGNDLIELLRAQRPLDRIANERVQANGAERRAAFPEIAQSLRDGAPQLAFIRPYTPELTGWFDDFSTSGAYDALGAFSRAGLSLNQFTVAPTTGDLIPVPPELREEMEGNLETGRNNRCPGSTEREALFKPSPDFNCDANIKPVGR